MKINSSTIKLEGQDYKSLEDVVKKIAVENKIEDVESIEIKLSSEEGLVTFKRAQAALLAPAVAGVASAVAEKVMGGDEPAPTEEAPKPE